MALSSLENEYIFSLTVRSYSQDWISILEPKGEMFAEMSLAWYLILKYFVNITIFLLHILAAFRGA